MIVERGDNFVINELCLSEGPPFGDRHLGVLEQRKEKSRDAARSRRGKENYEFYELAKLLPLPTAITSQLDKASIIRLTISYLKLRDFSSHGHQGWTLSRSSGAFKLSATPHSGVGIADSLESRLGTHILQALDGFVFVLGCDSRFLYVSETVSIYLGLSQVEMAGSSIFDYVHPEDHEDLSLQLGFCPMTIGREGSPCNSGSENGFATASQRPGTPPEKGYKMVQGQDKTTHKSFCVRMKSTLSKRAAHFKSSGYRVIHIVGNTRVQVTGGGCRPNYLNNIRDQRDSLEAPALGFVGMAIALPAPTISELRLEVATFVTRLSPDFRVLYCEPIISDLADLSAEEVNGRLLYDLCHTGDLQGLRRSHLDILNKGQAVTNYYRLISRRGSQVWVQTCATMMFNFKNCEDQTILAINFVLGNTRNADCGADMGRPLSQAATSEKKMLSTSEEEPSEKQDIRKPVPTSINSHNHIHSVNTKRVLSNENHPSRDLPKHKPQRLTSHSSLPEPNRTSSRETSSTYGISAHKRRKLDIPRKRKRNSDTQDDDSVCKALNLARTSVISQASDDSTRVPIEHSLSVSSWGSPTRNHPGLNPDNTVSQPEDLSVKRTQRKSTNRHVIQHFSGNPSPASGQDSSFQRSTSAIEPSPMRSPIQRSVTRSSLSDIEVAVNHHSSLPNSQKQSPTFNIFTSEPTSLHRGFENPFGPRLSSLQQPPWHVSPPFLHSLYSSRESVIKSNSRPQPPYLNGELPSSLLTPPEPDPEAFRDVNNQFSFEKRDALDYANITVRDLMFEARDIPARNHSFNVSYKDHIRTSYLERTQPSSYYRTYKELPSFHDIPSFSIPSLTSSNGLLHPAYPSIYPQFAVHIPTAPDICRITPPSPDSPGLKTTVSDTSHFDMATVFSRDPNSSDFFLQHANNKLPFPITDPPSHMSAHHYHIPRQRHVAPLQASYYAASPVLTDGSSPNSPFPQSETSSRHTRRWY